MSEAKFTKGEWVVSDNEYYLDIHVVDDEGYYLDQVCMGVSYDSRGNAPLIAAAPEMYKEIESDIANLNSLLMDMDPYTLEASATERKIKRKTKLLAKARGE